MAHPGRARGTGAATRRIRYRVGQFLRGLAPVVPARDLALAAAALTPEQLTAFRLQPAADQRHAARVVRAVLAAGSRDPDLVVAALLHDLGKVAPDGRGRARLPHRVAKVLLARRWPAVWGWLAGRPRRGPLLGCYLLERHPALGAAWAAQLGCTPGARALIAAHQDGRMRSAECGVRNDGPPDIASSNLAASLRLLRRADDDA